MAQQTMNGAEFELDLSWMEKQGEWDSHATPSKNGLTLADIQIGSYGEAPVESRNLSGKPRGSVSRPGSMPIGNYTVRTKSEIWLENASFLYEEALQRQWSSATDVPWHTIEPLPDDIEQAQCQMATFLTEVEFVAGDVPSRWVSQTSPDFYEARNVLMAQVMDESRHMDVFRKRALANGGGLMRATGATAGFVGGIDLSRDFTEMSSRLHISGEGAVLTIFRMGELMAYNDAEKAIYRLCAQDEARHVAFGVMHMRYMAANAPERHEEINCYLDEAERGMLTDAANPAGQLNQTSESLSIMLGGGRQYFDEGFRKLVSIRRRQLQEYQKRVTSAGFGERFKNGRSHLKQMMSNVAN
ncbi:MAG: ferritin-like domain-containing protein [Gammaproteobacteria bacterium]|nr:ferritin-like domain-containing protein [Gammaproteobacteria bacterium]